MLPKARIDMFVSLKNQTEIFNDNEIIEHTTTGRSVGEQKNVQNDPQPYNPSLLECINSEPILGRCFLYFGIISFLIGLSLIAFEWYCFAIGRYDMILPIDRCKPPMLL